MESYLLKSNISLIIFYALFYVLRKYEINHQLNRFVGWVCLFFSTVILFVPLSGFFESSMYPTEIYTVMHGTFDIKSGFANNIKENSIGIFFIIYIIGAGVFSLRSLIGLVTLLNFYFKSKKYYLWGFRVVALDRNVSPFTFFNILFIGNQNLECDNIQVIVEHERVHRDQLHSLDTLILELLTIIFWFNPAIWFFQRDIRAEHEYLADEQVLKKGFKMLEYQYLLFRMKTGISTQLGNYLSNKTSLNKRINMMTKQNKNTKISYFKVLLLLPLMVAALAVSSFTEIYNGNDPDTPAMYREGMAAMYKAIGNSIKYPLSARRENSSGLVYISFDVDEKGNVENVTAKRKQGTLLEKMVVVGYVNTPQENSQQNGVNDAIKTESIRVVEGLGKFVPAQKNNKPVSSVLVLPIEFLLR